MTSGFGRDAGPPSAGPRGPATAFGAGAATSPPPATPSIPIPFSSVRPASPLAVAGASRFPSPRPDVNPAMAAATARHVARHLQPQPGLSAPSVSRQVDPSIPSRSRSPSPLSHRHLDSSADYDNGMGQRRMVNYADPLFENGSVQPSEQMRLRPPDFGKTIKSSLSNIASNIRSPLSFQSYPSGQIPDPRYHVYKSDLSPSKFGNQNQSPMHDTRSSPDPPSASSPLLNNNRLVAGRPHPALGGAAPSPSLLGDVTHYNNSTRSVIAQQEMSEQLQPQRFSAQFQRRSLDHNISKRSRSPTFSYQDVDAAEARRDAGANARRLVDYTDTLIDDGNVEASKRMRSPSSEFISNIRPPPADFGSNDATQNLHSPPDVQKFDASPPKFGNQMQSRIGDMHSTPHLMFHRSDSSSNEHSTPAVSPPKSSILNPPKRSQTPLNANDDNAITPSTELEREKQAKAKRLARFSVELSRPVENANDGSKVHKSSADKQKQASSVENIPMESNNGTDEGTLGGMDSPGSAAIAGLCPDMCPESEREERERKGDLDRYERLDGDRNQTTELLAVKKYNRTAERDADLIRPLPVLQKSMDYLLSLLDHAYDDSFLGLYNFLWDRMRAIRMDLRMQHFFNREAISMLEQMIRLHIIAMHELCEYNRGEGFSEGFDAHLNIEQMNKTSVELFQMYDDHRRKGIVFPSEKEFRGYYALLKLDKHPGYKVEPAELSLDLAKMSHEIRGSAEILFAREVARACRIGNFIAFFRLARQATYLQACLMHAHFAKLRRQALASLHSGLQNTQGIPVSHVVGWLAMEGEEIDTLLEYHGFGLRQYEEFYLVKDGPFLNAESDFPSGCSQLVHSKKSQRVISDVSSGPVCTSASKRETVLSYSGRFAPPVKQRESGSPYSSLRVPVGVTREFASLHSGSASPSSGRQIASPYSGPFSPTAVNKLISSPYSSPISPTAGKKVPVSDFSCPASPRAGKHEIVSNTVWMDEEKVASPEAKKKMAKPVLEFIPAERDNDLAIYPQEMELQRDAPLSQVNMEGDDASIETIVSQPVVDVMPLDNSDMNGREGEFRVLGPGTDADMDEGIPPDSEVNTFEIGPSISPRIPGHLEYGEHKTGNKMAGDRFPIVVSPKTKISSERLKMMLRKWKQHAADKKFLREQKNALAMAALSSLSLGPPVHHTAAVPKHVVQELDFGHALKERYTRQQRSWSRLNVSELVGPILIERNADARCLCWKLLVLVPPGAMESGSNNLVSRWLLRKLMGCGNEDSGLLVSSTDLSIWTKWISAPNRCCLSVVRASDWQVIGNDITNSTSCMIFVVSESIPWEMQKARFSSLVASMPAQSSLPLLIVSSDTHMEGHDDASRTIIDRLGLSGLGEGKISSYSVVFPVGNYMEGYGNGFFDEDKLQEGLKWLANHLPLQPSITLVKTRELLVSYLKTPLAITNDCAASEVGPEHCISVFNNAVDQLTEEILAASDTQPNQWPPLEIELLERSSGERIFADMYLPSIGWSLPSRTQPLLAVIKNCKLPEFSSHVSWLKQGSYMGRQIQDQRSTLEECLTKYLTQSAQLLNESQAATEVKVMVQKCVGLEIRDSYYYLTPRWMSIFWRIYNWRLVKLSYGEFAEVYVLDQHLYQVPAANSNVATPLGFIATSSTVDERSILEDQDMMPAVSSHLTLDEIIEISCDLHAVNEPSVKSLPPRMPALVHEEPQAPADVDGEVNGVHGVIDGMPVSGNVQLRELLPPRRDDKLARLLEKCTKLQDKIDETLAIYF